MILNSMAKQLNLEEIFQLLHSRFQKLLQNYSNQDSVALAYRLTKEEHIGQWAANALVIRVANVAHELHVDRKPQFANH